MRYLLKPPYGNGVEISKEAFDLLFPYPSMHTIDEREGEPPNETGYLYLVCYAPIIANNPETPIIQGAVELTTEEARNPGLKV